MADIESSDPSLVAPVAVIPIQTAEWEPGGLEKRELELTDSSEKATSHPVNVAGPLLSEDEQQSKHGLSQPPNSGEATTDSLSVSSGILQQTTELTENFPLNVDSNEKLKHSASGQHVETSNSMPSTVSSSPVQQHATTVHSLHPPQMKRFTSVNITKRFLEKTSSLSGSSLGTSLNSSTNPVLNSSSQHRGVSPNCMSLHICMSYFQHLNCLPLARSPSFDRPVSSRLVTAKLTAVPQPSSASTAGWLRPGQTTNSATPTPPSTSPQPPLHESTSLQTIKRRPGISPAPNGTSIQVSSQSNKPVWAKFTPSNPAGKNSPALDNQNDFPTAAEAVHSMQSGVLSYYFSYSHLNKISS